MESGQIGLNRLDWNCLESDARLPRGHIALGRPRNVSYGRQMLIIPYSSVPIKFSTDQPDDGKIYVGTWS